MKSILAIIKKEILQIRRDKFMLRLLLISPIIQLLVLGYAMTFETKHVKMTICNLDKGQASRLFIQKLQNNDRFQIIGYTKDYTELEKQIRTWKTKVGLYIPPDFSLELNTKGTGTMQALLDAVDGNQATTAFGYLQQIAADHSMDLIPGFILKQAVNKNRIVRPNTHFLFNPELKTEAFMVPGVIVLLLTIITLMIGSLGMVREKENGTLEQLMVTPIKKYQLILGKQLPFLIYSFFEIIIIISLASLVFNLEIRGSILTLYLMAFLFLFTTLGGGLLVSTISSTQQQALFLGWFFMVLMIMLSGLFIPIENMPSWLQYITYLNPMRYMMTGVREIYLKATPLPYLLPQIIPLAGLGLSVFTLSTLKFSKKIS